MFRKALLSAVALVGLLGATGAQAAVFDFAAAANLFESGYRPYVMTRDGITVTARGYRGSHEVFAYLDGGNAGLGVCGFVGENRLCNPSNDDNVTSSERLNLTFDRQVSITNTYFRNDGHVATFPRNAFVDIAVDTDQQMNDIALPRTGGNYATTLTGTSFDFIYNNQQFYIGSLVALATHTPGGPPAHVPEPASALLLGAGLLGLMANHRRRG